MKLLALACASVLLLAGCDVMQPAEQVIVYATVPSGALAPGIEADNAMSTAQALAWIATQDAIDKQNTVSASDALAAQAAQAQVQATQAAADATLKAEERSAAATLQVEQYNANATQQAVSVGLTATAGSIALYGRELEITQTAIVVTLDGAEANIKSAEARQAEVDADQAAKVAQQADIDRQTDYIFKLVGGILLVAVVFSAFLVALLYGARWLSVIIAIDVRRRMILEELGLQYDNNAGEWVPLPGHDWPALPAPEPEPEPEREITIAGRVYTQEDLEDAEKARQEQAHRTAWRNAAIAFLRWGEHKIDDEPMGYSRARMTAHAGVTDPTWRTMTKWLAEMGFMYQPRTGAAYTLTLNDVGEHMTVSQIIQSPKWATSYDYPKGEIVSIEPPKTQKSLDPTQPAPPVSPGRNRVQPANPPENGAFVVGTDENGRRTVRRWGGMGPPGSYDAQIDELCAE